MCSVNVTTKPLHKNPPVVFGVRVNALFIASFKENRQILCQQLVYFSVQKASFLFSYFYNFLLGHTDIEWSPSISFVILSFAESVIHVIEEFAFFILSTN